MKSWVAIRPRTGPRTGRGAAIQEGDHLLRWIRFSMLLWLLRSCERISVACDCKGNAVRGCTRGTAPDVDSSVAEEAE